MNQVYTAIGMVVVGLIALAIICLLVILLFLVCKHFFEKLYKGSWLYFWIDLQKVKRLFKHHPESVNGAYAYHYISKIKVAIESNNCKNPFASKLIFIIENLVEKDKRIRAAYNKAKEEINKSIFE